MSIFKELVIITISIFYLSQAATSTYAEEEDECVETSCREGSPIIRFPFRLKATQPSYCGYPGFDLYCTKHNHTLLELPFSVNLFVKQIDYKNQLIRLQDPGMCLPRHLRKLNLTASPFNFNQPHQYGYTFFNCTSVNNHVVNISCLGSPGYQVYALHSDSYLAYVPSFSSCTKMYDVPSVPYDAFQEDNDLVLNWLEPFCSACENCNQMCRLKSDCHTTPLETECYGHLKTRKGGTEMQPAVSVLCSLIPMVVIAITCYIYRDNKAERENHVRIEKFLEDYKALKPTRYSYADIKRITNDFKEKLGEGTYGTVFKGKVCKEITVAVKILNNSNGNGDEFINEVGTIGRIHHVNVVRLVGYCADGFRWALVYEFLPNESLEKFIFSKDRNKHVLGWEKLLKIALGVAKGIEYLHQGCEQRILHFDIKPQNVLLDYNFNPKISDFGLAKLCTKDRSAVTMTAARGTMGYVAPEVFSRKFGKVSYKSDVYSFGMLLLEMVGGRKNTDEKVENSSQIYFPEWIYNILDQGEELRIYIEEEGDTEIAKRIAIVGLWCIQWHPINRPSMKTVIQMLEEGDNLRIPPNPFSSKRSHTSSQIMNGKLSEKEFTIIYET